MSKGKIKIILFLIVFLLTLAVVCNLLIDLSEQKKAASSPVTTSDPYTEVSATPGSSGTVVVETAPPTANIPTVSTLPPVYTAPITPIAPATPTPTPTPSESLLPIPTATPMPADTVIGSGQFLSETGLPINIAANWTATVVDENTVKVSVSVDLSSYSLFISESPAGVYVNVGEQYKSGATPAVSHEENTLINTHLCTTEHILKLSTGNTATYPVAVEYHFGGTYKKQELPVIECGGEITLSR